MLQLRAWNHRQTTFSTHRITPSTLKGSKYRNEVKKRKYTESWSFWIRMKSMSINLWILASKRESLLQAKSCAIISPSIHLTLSNFLIYSRLLLNSSVLFPLCLPEVGIWQLPPWLLTLLQSLLPCLPKFWPENNKLL